MNGKIAKSGITSGTISINDISNGSYILKIITKTGIQTGKFIKE